jgi:hypothetical protein
MNSPQVTELQLQARRLGLVLTTDDRYANCAGWRLVSLLNPRAQLESRTRLEDIDEQLDLFCKTEKLARDLWLLGVGVVNGAIK